MACNWTYFPATNKPPTHLRDVVEIFDDKFDEISSTSDDSKWLKSNEVLEKIVAPLSDYEFEVEAKKNQIGIPVLYDKNGEVKESAHFDAFHPGSKTIVEVESGRAVMNNQALKVLIDACMAQDVEYLCIAVKNVYTTGKDADKETETPDYETVKAFFTTLFASKRMDIPLKGIMLIGY